MAVQARDHLSQRRLPNSQGPAECDVAGVGLDRRGGGGGEGREEGHEAKEMHARTCSRAGGPELDSKETTLVLQREEAEIIAPL